MSSNRLASCLSPYLRQHAANPVHWQPWDDRSHQEAAQTDRPIFLSVGYSSCHWCHVMEHESFENAEIARILNDNFVSIKVDREELPDVDDAYMTAVQLSAGRGGWPMSVFLTPELKPFFAGTYFPPEDRGPHAGFRSLVQQIARGWLENRAEFVAAADELANAVEAYRSSPPPQSSSLSLGELVAHTRDALRLQFDPIRGGFGGAPKFPPHTALDFLLHLARAGDSEALEMARLTLDAMMLGGIHDHVGGGFHRYATDSTWLLPHFEKMLYDNALLLRCYGRLHALTGDSAYRRVCDRLCGWLDREMLTTERLYCSALDADSEGEEGAFTTWSRREVDEVLGEDSAGFRSTYRIEEAGNFRDEASGRRTGKNIPHLSERPADWMDAALDRLREARDRRVRPALDDKSLIAWNGLLLGGLAVAGEIDRARALAEALVGLAELPHFLVGGEPQGEAYGDAMYVEQGLLDLADADGDDRWRAAADKLYDQLRAGFRDPDGGWHFTRVDKRALFGRPKPGLDSPLPSINGIAIQCAVRLGRDDDAALDAECMRGWVERAPTGAESLALGLAMLADSKPAAGVGTKAPSVALHCEPREVEVRGDGATFVIRASPPVGWHLQPNADGLPLEVATARSAPLSIEALDETGVRLTVPAPAGPEGEFTLQVTFQACTDQMCETSRTVEISVPWHRP